MKHWNLGNTTVRNPDRIREGLRVLKKFFEGKPFTEKEQLEFFDKLQEEGVIEQFREIKDSSKEISGRKWAACFNQLGLSCAWKTKGPVVITDAGNALLDGDVIEEDIFLKQFLKYNLPNEIESSSLYEGFDVNPIYVILSLLKELEKEGIRGISKEEIGLYIITCLQNDDIESAKRKIMEYRTEYKKTVGKVKKKELYYKKKSELILDLYDYEIRERIEYLELLTKNYSKDKSLFQKDSTEQLINDIIAGGKGPNTKRSQELKKIVISSIKEGNIKPAVDDLLDMFVEVRGGTLHDYADTTVRYTVKTGLLSISGDKLIIKEDKELFVSKLLEISSSFLKIDSIEDYYSSTLPHLPSDNVDFLQKNLSGLQARYTSLVSQLQTSRKPLLDVSKEKNPNKLRKIQHDIEMDILSLRERKFYREQAKEEMINDILEYYDKIMDRSLLGGDAYRPAYLEWTTWRLFLAINSILNDISKTRNFRIDEELNPIHHAKAGEPDMVFEYDDFLIVCEVTLRTTENQWSEEEPVPRHVANVVANTDKEVYGVFIAPKIDPNTSVEFFRKQRVIKGELKAVNIISFTIEQAKKLLIKFNKHRYSTEDLRKLLKKLADFQTDTENPLEWQKLVNREMEKWVEV
jgi:hypothetical protein